MRVGVVLPNYGRAASADGVRVVAEAAEELGFDSVWTTEHIIVGPAGVDPYGRVLDPLGTLAWIAGFTSHVRLGTSIVLVPLHHPIRLAKEVATLDELSGGRAVLGVGVGWHEDEYRFMGVDFAGRGRRADESIRLLRELWSGRPPFPDATFEPVPHRQPELWVGGNSDRAVRRARELGDVWHPVVSGGDSTRIREVRARWPELRIFPRVAGGTAAAVAAALDDLAVAGCEGAIAGFGDDPARAVAELRAFAARR
jgi:probable F420-dependent oxidoreductase